ncbi:YcaO-like family protein [Leisingera sp. ANG-Vp]|uniref:YcaO-like family protein n=1 Tax=Leisingera sp. ANG-Vp TaxID=1577896 RepID=UPI00057DAAE7|nr:YcaO-like family protein [Leisingera sp. ANG-Vp]
MSTTSDFVSVQSGLCASDFDPQPIVTASGHVRLISDTLATVAPILPKVPVTRVYDLSTIDSLGLPVWGAVTPLAADITVHSGKGETPEAAKASAIMEAIERVCGESLPSDRQVRCSLSCLLERQDLPIVTPGDLNAPAQGRLTNKTSIHWTKGYDVQQKTEIWLPSDAVITPPQDGVFQGVETNGLASGNSIAEATLHAIYEVIERDAASIDRFIEEHGEAADGPRFQPRMLSTHTLPPTVADWVARLRSENCVVTFQDQTSDLGVPVIAAHVLTRRFPGNMNRDTVFVGHGCDYDAGRAALRAVTEAVQAHSVTLLGARDAIEGMRPRPDRASRLLRRIRVLNPDALATFDFVSDGDEDIARNTNRALKAMRTVGLDRCIVVNMTRAELGVPVVRVVVPGLECPYSFTTRLPGDRLLRSLI